MPRPKSKEELLTLGKANYDKLIRYIDSFSKEAQIGDFPEGTLNRNIRDVLGHLHHWHLLMVKWHEIGMKGEKPAMPEEGHTWRTVPELNAEIQKLYSEIPLIEIKDELQKSFDRLQKVIAVYSDEELFTKKKYKWTGSTSLAAYLISATSSHYDWGYKLIKRMKKGES